MINVLQRTVFYSLPVMLEAQSIVLVEFLFI